MLATQVPELPATSNTPALSDWRTFPGPALHYFPCKTVKYTLMELTQAQHTGLNQPKSEQPCGYLTVGKVIFFKKVNMGQSLWFGTSADMKAFFNTQFPNLGKTMAVRPFFVNENRICKNT